MKKNLLMIFLASVCILAACSKSTDPAPATPSAGDPKKGSTWTFKDTYYDQREL